MNSDSVRRRLRDIPEHFTPAGPAGLQHQSDLRNGAIDVVAPTISERAYMNVNVGPDSYQSSSASGLEAHRALDHAPGGPNSLARASFPAGNGALMRIGTNQVRV